MSVVAIIQAISSLASLAQVVGTTGAGDVARRLWLHDKSIGNAKLDLSSLDSIFFIKRYAWTQRSSVLKDNEQSNDMGIQNYRLFGIHHRGSNGQYSVDTPSYVNHFLYDKKTGYIIADLAYYCKEKGKSSYLNFGSSSPDIVLINCIQKLIDDNLIFVSASAGYTSILTWNEVGKRYTWAGHICYDHEKATKGKIIENCCRSPFFRGGTLSTFKQLPDLATAFSEPLNLKKDNELLKVYWYFNWIFTEHNYTFLLDNCIKSGLLTSVQDMKDYPPGRYSDRMSSYPFRELNLSKYQKAFFTPFTVQPSDYSPYLPSGLMLVYYQFHFGKLTEDQINMILKGETSGLVQTTSEATTELNTSKNMEKVINWVKAHWMLLVGVAGTAWLIWRYKKR